MTGMEIPILAGIASSGAAASAGVAAGVGTATAASMAVSAGMAVGGAAMEYQGAMDAAEGGIAAAEAQAAMRDYEASQMDTRAAAERATVHMAAREERRKATLLSSRAQALAAASGGGASDKTVADIEADIIGEGEFRALSLLYEGEERARDLETGADLQEYEGRLGIEAAKISKKATKRRATAGLFSSVASAGMQFASAMPGTPTKIPKSTFKTAPVPKFKPKVNRG